MELDCKQCGRTLPENMFRKKSKIWHKTRNGRNTTCKECEYGYIPLEFRTEKKCPICKKTKSLDQYQFLDKKKKYKYYCCKKCQNILAEISRGYKGNRTRNLKKKYGIDEGDYIRMLKEQNYKCKICGVTLEDYIMRFKGGKQADGKSIPSKFSIDHCHTTGKIRGLLCNGCNTGLGQFQDSPELLIKASEYLKERQPNFSNLINTY